jgi:hypothetical protein
MNVLVTKKQFTIAVEWGAGGGGFYITNDDLCLGK